MGFGSNHRALFAVASLFFILSHVSAQESLLENENKDSNAGATVLGRRGMITTNDLDNNSVGIGLNLDSGLGTFDALFASLSMIIVSEIGDETFIIAALMAMRHPKSIVLSGALAALIVMTFFMPFLGFAALHCLEIRFKIITEERNRRSRRKTREWTGKTAYRRFFSRFCTPIFLESFILTFLAEWGDRSQIATIALATHKNAVGVAVGAIIGHSLCTSLAVVGGSMLASKISQRTVATIGGLLFLGFSLSSYFYPPL